MLKGIFLLSVDLFVAFYFIACGGSNSSGSAANSSRIQHIIVMVQENHSFDNYFGQFPGANGATLGQTSTGQGIALAPGSDTPANCGHTWADAHGDVNGGRMNGFDLNCPNLGAYIQYNSSQIPGYWQLAHKYALADNMFATLEGPSFPTHSYIFAGNSQNAVDNPLNVVSQKEYGWGCDAAAVGGTVHSINPSTGLDFWQPPCFSFKTMAEVLDAARVSWRAYSPQPGTSGYMWNFVSYFSQLWHGNDRKYSVPNSQFLSDVGSCQLPQISWIIPSLDVSEHPPQSVSNGMNWVVQQISAVMNSSCGYWHNSVIILTWDDWGGFYDHVAPPVKSFFGFGIRVPLLLISPYSKTGYVSHTLYSYDSINALIEHTFQTSCLASDCSSSTNDLSDMLDFSQTPLAAVQLKMHPVIRIRSPIDFDGRTISKDDDDDQ